MSIPGVLERIVFWLLPAAERETVLGDLNEEFGSASNASRLSAFLSVGCHFHLEPYRRPERVVLVIGLFTLCFGVMWAVLVASANMFVADEWMTNTLIRSAALVWGASHVTSAVAAGLIVGRIPLGLATSGAVRLHVGVLLAIGFVLLLDGFVTTTIAVVVLFSALYFGNRARTDFPSVNDPVSA